MFPTYFPNTFPQHISPTISPWPSAEAQRRMFPPEHYQAIKEVSLAVSVLMCPGSAPALALKKFGLTRPGKVSQNYMDFFHGKSQFFLMGSTTTRPLTY